MRIIVLAGGNSPEREVSLASGEEIAKYLRKKGHEVMLLDLKDGIESEKYPPIYLKESYEKSTTISKSYIKNENAIEIGPGVVSLCQEADKVFLALHGGIGENGKLQALFDLYNIKYTGSNYLGSAIAMDKDLSKQLMSSNDILTPKWQTISEENMENINIKIPCVVKPCSCGSSVGVSIVNTKEELDYALKEAFKYESKILLEEKIVGREFSIGILGKEALPIIEIIPNNGFYNFENKYQAGKAVEICPAKIPADITKQMQGIALKTHQALHLGYYSRIDLLMDNKNNIYCIEANTLPGMTNTSLFPQEAASANISFEELCEKMINEN